MATFNFQGIDIATVFYETYKNLKQLNHGRSPLAIDQHGHYYWIGSGGLGNANAMQLPGDVQVFAEGLMQEGALSRLPDAFYVYADLGGSTLSAIEAHKVVLFDLEISQLAHTVVRRLFIR